MAALSEVEMRKILGASYDEVMGGGGSGKSIAVINAEQAMRSNLQAADDNRTFALYVVFVGAALVVASLFSVSGWTLIIQIAVGVVISALGALGYLYFRKRLTKLRAQQASSQVASEVASEGREFMPMPQGAHPVAQT
jgi:hypothetical protein